MICVEKSRVQEITLTRRGFYLRRGHVPSTQYVQRRSSQIKRGHALSSRGIYFVGFDTHHFYTSPLHFVSCPFSSSLSARPRPSSLSSVSHSLASSLIRCLARSPTVSFDHQLSLSCSVALRHFVSLSLLAKPRPTQLTELSFSLAHSFIVKVLSVSRILSIVFFLAKSSPGDSDSRSPLFTHLDRIINIRNRGIYLLL
ncbi:hypothetical protein PanWU01x14_262840 [Parasponia andersonii]|uniref:Uncharacterized protein n=1 Tax=Parasponia andersonii TaxID=3476 RepID=A0A2P5B823_PARAD|nr:hypothetical protein PanWU01x14_262840 [Parasponia andersonii]